MWNICVVSVFLVAVSPGIEHRGAVDAFQAVLRSNSTTPDRAAPLERHMPQALTAEQVDGCLASKLDAEIARPDGNAPVRLLSLQKGVNFNLSWFTLGGGGGFFTSGADYELSGTIAQPDAAVMTGGDYELEGGFWPVTQNTSETNLIFADGFESGNCSGWGIGNC